MRGDDIAPLIVSRETRSTDVAPFLAHLGSRHVESRAVAG